MRAAGRALLAVASLHAVEAASADPRLAVRQIAFSVWDTDPHMVGISILIGNDGAAVADAVRIVSIDVRGGIYAQPSALPIRLGDIPAGGAAVLDLVVSVPAADGRAYALRIGGLYGIASRTHDFTLDASLAPAPGAPAPPPTGNPTRSIGPNATTPMMIPPGPTRQLHLPIPERPTRDQAPD